MPSLAEVSLAVIAAAFAAAVIALVPVLIQLRRTVMRADTVLASVGGELPELLADLRGLMAKLNRTTDMVASLAASMERLDKLTVSAARTAEGVLTTVRQIALDVVLPSLANAAGLLAALREGVEFVRPRRERRRDDL